MRPAFGVLAEACALACFLFLSTVVPRGVPFGIYVVAAELVATYLIHCPAHYLVGFAVGLRFRKLSLGKTTLAKVIPARFSTIANLIPILTLSTDKGSRAGVSKGRLAAMYASGTIASASSAVVIAAVATQSEPLAYSALAWAVALFYLMFDIVFSPKSGDLSRARAVLASNKGTSMAS